MAQRKSDMLEGLTFSGEKLTQDRLLAVLTSERQRSIGLDNDNDLNRHRELALEYYRGMVPDMPVAVDEDGKPVDTNRSKAVSTDLADAVETIMPDLMEVFFGGEDALTFRAHGEEDVDAAEQETDYVRQIVFHSNDGFSNAYEWFKESLLCRTGIAKWWWDDDEEFEEYEGEANLAELQEMQEMGIELVDAEPCAPESDEEYAQGLEPPRYKYEARKLVRPATVNWMAVPSSDFGVAPETGRLKDAPYAVMRSRPQKQELIAQGHDPETVRSLSMGDEDDDGGVDEARETSDEDDDATESMGDLARCEIHEHYIRADFEGAGRPQIWRIITGNAEKVLLDIEKRAAIEFAALCPFPMMFQFYGQDLADKVMPWQRINSALLRNGLDNNSFQLNARMEVADDRSTENTLDDLQNNEPGHPIRVKSAGAISPVRLAALSVNPFETIEQMKTMSEQSSGIIRGAQGLNPDSLHKTKGGMQIQQSAAQKRARMMARLYAETGVRDLFMGVHSTLRSHATRTDTILLRGKWTEVAPSDWQRRSDMVVEVGVGSGGREQDIQAKQMLADYTSEIIQAQGGINGPLVRAENIYALYKSLGDRLGEKQISQYITDPSQAPPQQGGEQPDPDVIEAQAEAQREQQSLQFDQSMRIREMDAKQAAELKRIEMEDARKRDQMQAEFELKRDQMALEAQLKRESFQWGAVSTGGAPGGDVKPGGAVG